MKLEDVLDSKIYVKESGAVKFEAPKYYLEPFIDSLGENVLSYRVEVASPVSNQNVDSDDVNTAYPKVLVEAHVGTHIEGFDSVIGMIYSLDSKPIVKVYSGENARACINLTIFNVEHVFEQNLLTNYKDVYGKTLLWRNNKEKQAVEFETTLKKLQNQFMDEKQLNELMGYLLLKSRKARIGTSPIVSAAQYLTDPASTYYPYHGEEFRCSRWNVYNSVTQSLHSSDILSKPTKTVSLAKLFLN